MGNRTHTLPHSICHTFARLSAPEIPHHAAQTLVNYFYYIHGFTCTVTQFIGCESGWGSWVSVSGFPSSRVSSSRVPCPIYPDKWAPALLPVAFASGSAPPQLMWSAVNMRQPTSVGVGVLRNARSPWSIYSILHSPYSP